MQQPVLLNLGIICFEWFNLYIFMSINFVHTLLIYFKSYIGLIITMASENTLSAPNIKLLIRLKSALDTTTSSFNIWISRHFSINSKPNLSLPF